MATSKKTNTQDPDFDPKWEHYSYGDKGMVREIHEWSRRNKQTLKFLADHADVDYQSLKSAMRGEVEEPTILLKKAVEFLLSQWNITAFAETSIWNRISLICDEATNLGSTDSIGVIYGYVGVGKTTALTRYANINKNVIYIRAFQSMPTTTLLDRLVKESDAQVSRQNQWGRGSNADKVDAIVDILRGSSRLIIIDEATRMVPSCIEMVRDIADDAGVGLVLAGREMLLPMLQDEQGRFGEISSRVFMWPDVMKRITPNDVELIVKAAIDGLNAETIDMFWQCSDGNARKLGQLIMRVKAYCKNKKLKPNPEIVSRTNQRTLRKDTRRS